MQRVVVSCSSLKGEEREEIYRIVQAMGGRICRDFLADVTHLISQTTTSEKYAAALKLRRPVVTPEWVWKSREIYQELQSSVSRDGKTSRRFDNPVDSFDATTLVQEYLLKPFVGCTICVTGLDEELREKIERETLRNGGTYSRDLTRACTHLLAESPTGSKFEAALKWNINVLSPEWFFDSLDMGGCMEERFYSLTREGAARGGAPTTPRKSGLHQAKENAKTGSTTPSLSSGGGPLQRPYLQGFRIFLGPGFSDEKLIHMTKILREGGATRATEITPTLTHYVTAHAVLTELDRELLAAYLPSKKQAQLPFAASSAAALPPFSIVSNVWLRECYQKGRFVPTKPHEPVLVDPVDYSLVTEQPTVQNQGRHQNQTHHALGHAEESPVNEFTVIDLQEAAHNTNTSLFEGMSFRVEGFIWHQANMIHRLLKHQKGSIVTSVTLGCDFVLLPFSATRPRSLDSPLPNKHHPSKTDEDGGGRAAAAAHLPKTRGAMSATRASTLFVTEYWLERCLRDQAFVSPSDNVLYRPCEYSLPLPHFSEFSISISGFEGVEREHIPRLIAHLGASFTDRFSRKNTHLICLSPQGPKFEHAARWSIPVVEVHWLYACATEGASLPIGGFIISLPPPLPSSSVSYAPLYNENHHKQQHTGGGGGGQVPEDQLIDGEGEFAEAKRSKVLEGVVVCVSPKLQGRYEELARLAGSLGARGTFLYDASCTHLIHEGTKPNETFREFKLARTGGKFIVSPHWLVECRRQGVRMREMDFSHTYNPSKVLSSLLPAQASPTKKAGHNTAAETETETETTAAHLLERRVPSPKKPQELTVNDSEDEGADQFQFQQHQLQQLSPRQTPSKGKEKIRPENEAALLEPQTKQQETRETREKRVADEAAETDRRVPVAVIPVAQPQTHRKEQLGNNESHESIDLENCLEDILAATEKVRRSIRKSKMAKGPGSAALNTMRVEEEHETKADGQQKRKFAGEEGRAAVQDLPPAKRTRKAVSLSRIEGKALGPAFAGDDYDILAHESESPSHSQIPVTYDDPVSRRVRDNLLKKLTQDTIPQPQANAKSPKATKDRQQQQQQNQRQKDSQQYVFHLSNLKLQDKPALTAAIAKLGGRLIDSQIYDPSCTHLVIGEPTRSEKYLAACACGTWCLQPSYLFDSLKAGHFLPEQDYEWNEAAAPKPGGAQLFGAGRKWRLKAERSGPQWKGAFANWGAVGVVGDQQKRSGFLRLLGAGGAKAVLYDPPGPLPSGITAVIVGPPYRDDQQLQLQFSANGIKYVSSEYLGEFLINNAPAF